MTRFSPCLRVSVVSSPGAPSFSLRFLQGQGGVLSPSAPMSYNLPGPMLRTQLYADPANLFLHDIILNSCREHPSKLALLDTSAPRRLTYAEYGDTVETLARGLVAAGLNPGEPVAIFLPNSWEFAATYHAATLAGGIPTLLNPTYREREVRYQLENSGAVFLITDGPLLANINLSGLPSLRRVYTTRQPAPGTENFADLLRPPTPPPPHPHHPPHPP